MDDYIQDFERLVAQALELTEEQLLSYFFAGLQGDIRNQIKPHNPRDLLRVMKIARDVEDVTRDSSMNRGQLAGAVNRLEDMRENMGLFQAQNCSKEPKEDRVRGVTLVQQERKELVPLEGPRLAVKMRGITEIGGKKPSLSRVYMFSLYRALQPWS